MTSSYPEIIGAAPARVIKRLGEIISEWERWSEEVKGIVDQPYDSNTQLDVFADGEDMMQRHEVLQMKTVAFLNKNVRSHGFIKGFDGSHCDSTDLRLNHRVKHRLQDLYILRACLAEVGNEKQPAAVSLELPNVAIAWQQIERDLGVSKKLFGKKINFVGDAFKRKIIFRDVAQAYALAMNDFNKPAVILSGSIIEELLRLYLGGCPRIAEGQ